MVNDPKFQPSTNNAHDQELSEAELAELQARQTEIEEAAPTPQVRKVEKFLRETPQVTPLSGFSSRVMAAIAAMGLPDFSKRQMGLGLALGLLAVAFLTIPVLSILLIVLISVISNPGSIHSLFQWVTEGASYVLAMAGDLGDSLQDLVRRTPLVAVLLSASLPVAILWGWLVRHLVRGHRVAADQQTN